MSKSKLQVQSPYHICPPFARVASRILLAMELTRELIFLRGKWFHSCCKAAVSFWTLLGTRRRDRTRLSSSSYVIWGKDQDCKMASQVESRCSGLRSHGKLRRHAAWRYLVEMSDCAAAQRNHALTENSVSLLNDV